MTDRPAPAAPPGMGGAGRFRRLRRAVIVWVADWSLALPLIAVAGILLVAPALALIDQSLTDDSGAFTLANWTKTFHSHRAQRAVWHSLGLAASVATLVTLIGTPLSWTISRMTGLGRSVHLGILNIATNLSGIGLGFGYVAALGTYGMVTLALKAVGLDVTPPSQGSFTGLLLAYLYSNLPLFVLLSLPAMGLVRDAWWEAAQASAATRWQFWRYVGWPVLKPFILADWLLIFTWSVGMYGLPVALVGDSPGGFQLITVEMSRSLMGSFFGVRSMPVYGVLLMLIAAVSLVTYRLAVRRGTKWLS